MPPPPPRSHHRPLLPWQIVAVVVAAGLVALQRWGLPESLQRLRFRSGPMRYMEGYLQRLPDKPEDTIRVIVLGNSLARFGLGTGEELAASLQESWPGEGQLEVHSLTFPTVSFFHFAPYMWDILQADPDLLILQIDLLYPTGTRDSMRPQEMWVPYGEALVRRPFERTRDDQVEIQRDWSSIALTPTDSLRIGTTFLRAAAARQIPTAVVEIPPSHTLMQTVPAGYFAQREALVRPLLRDGQQLIRDPGGIEDALTTDYRHLNAAGQTALIGWITPQLIALLDR